MHRCSFQLKWTLKAQTTFIPFHTKYDLQGQSFDLEFLAQYYVVTPKQI